MDTFLKVDCGWGTWAAPLVEHPTLDFQSDHDHRVMRSSPHVGLYTECEACLELSLPLYCSLLAHCCSLLKKKKKVDYGHHFKED